MPALKATETGPQAASTSAAPPELLAAGPDDRLNDMLPARSSYRRRRHCRADRGARLCRSAASRCDVFERAETLDEIGAGHPAFAQRYAHPRPARRVARACCQAQRCGPTRWCCATRDDLAELARVPLGELAEQRWGRPISSSIAPTCKARLLDARSRRTRHRADDGRRRARFRRFAHGRVTVSVETGGEAARPTRVAARRRRRRLVDDPRAGRRRRQEPFLGQLAWRGRFVPTARPKSALSGCLCGANVVTAFLHPGFHLSPIRCAAAAAFNLVAFTRRQTRTQGRDWSGTGRDQPI